MNAKFVMELKTTAITADNVSVKYKKHPIIATVLKMAIDEQIISAN